MFDLLTTAAIADQCTTELLDGRIQRVGLADPRTLAFEVYANRRRVTLQASIQPENPRVLISEAGIPIDAELVTPLVLLLRKYCRGGVIAGIEQPPMERVIRMSIAKRLTAHNRDADPVPGIPEPVEPSDPEDDELPEDGLEDATFTHLVIEIMGRHSNIILVDDDDRVMESIKRVPPSLSRVRPILPRYSYQLPPVPDKPDPRRVTGADLAALLGDARPGADLATTLARSIRSVSPQIGREAVFLTLGDATRPVSAAAGHETTLASHLRRLYEPLITSAWAPETYRDADGEVMAYAAVPMEHLRAALVAEPAPSISAAVAALDAVDGGLAPSRHEGRRDRLVAEIDRHRRKVETRLHALEGEAAAAQDIDRYRRWGEAIYAWLWNIQPGQSELEVDGERIPIDPVIGPKETAQGYFERYRKAQGAGEHVPALVEQATNELAYLDQLRVQAEQAVRYDELEAAAAELAAFLPAPAAGKGGKRPRSRLAAPRPLRDPDGNTILIGRTGPQNAQVTFDLAAPGDLWLHARGVPGSHVILRPARAGVEPAEEAVLRAAAIAAWYSNARNAGRAEVDVTERRHVRKIRGAGPGLVTYRNEYTVLVAPHDETNLAG